MGHIVLSGAVLFVFFTLCLVIRARADKEETVKPPGIPGQSGSFRPNPGEEAGADEPPDKDFGKNSGKAEPCLIGSMEDVRLVQEKARFSRKARSLRADIRSKIESLWEKVDSPDPEGIDGPELREARRFMAAEMEELLGLPAETPEQLEYVEWRFNHGNLRSELEIIEHEDALRGREYVESEKWDSDCSGRNWKYGCIGFVVGFLVVLDPLFNFFDMWTATCIFALVPACLFAWLGLMISHTINIFNGRSMNVSEDNPRMRYEKFDRAAGAVSMSTGIVATEHHAKKAARDITNVEGWQKMK